jgi:Sulfotransferase family
MAAEVAEVAVVEPIVVLGAPRSGTSLVAGVLAAHPATAFAGEPRLTWRYGNDGRSDQLRPEHATPAVVAHIRSHFGRLLAEQGASRLVEKTPANAVRPRFVDAVLPDARFVHVVRNGWGAVPSLRAFSERRAVGFDAKQRTKLARRVREARPSQWRFYAGELAGRLRPGQGRAPYGPRLAGLGAVLSELGPLEAAALQWRTSVDQVTAFGRSLPPARYLEVRLESLDAGVIDRLLDFCGLPRDPAVTERFTSLFEPGLATGRSQLTAEERAVVAPYVLPANAWLGYGDDDQAGRPVAAGEGVG